MFSFSNGAGLLGKPPNQGRGLDFKGLLGGITRLDNAEAGAKRIGKPEL
jgi:hypothetical protein